jgi:hypothetical protein
VSAIDMPGFVANGEHLEWIALYNALAAASGTRATFAGSQVGSHHRPALGHIEPTEAFDFWDLAGIQLQ